MPRIPVTRRKKVLLAGGALVLAAVTACSSAAPTSTPRPEQTATPTQRPAATATPCPTATATPAPTATSGGGTTPAATRPAPTETPDSGPRALAWEVLDVGPGTKPALALLSDGTPVVAYMLEAINGFVKAAILEDAGWKIEEIAEGYFYGPLDVAAGPDDAVHVAYHDHQGSSFQPDRGDAVYAVRRNGRWEASPAEDNGHDGWDNRIVVDAQGRVHMSGMDPSDFGGNGAEYDALRSDGGWDVEEVGSGPLTSRWATSVAVDPSGNPHITYFDQSGGELRLASRDGSG